MLVNKKEITVDAKEGQAGVIVGELMGQAGYPKEDYDLFLISGGTAERLDPDGPVSVEDGVKFNAVRRSNPYG